MIFNKMLDEVYKKYYRKRFKSSFADLRFTPKDSTFDFCNIEIGRRVFVNRRAYFSAPNGLIKIGDDVLIGADCFLCAGHHKYSEIGKKIREQRYGGGNEFQYIIIEDDVWIASKVSILGNITVGEGSVIGACSLVIKDLPPYSVCLGNPCRPIKFRYSDDELKVHLQELGKDEEYIAKIIIRRKNGFG